MEYTVVGILGIDNERYGTAVEAADAREAERKACEECLEANGEALIVAAVIKGKVEIVG